MWIENVVEEGTGEITGTDSHKGLFIRFAKACGYSKEELDRVPGSRCRRYPAADSAESSSSCVAMRRLRMIRATASRRRSAPVTRWSPAGRASRRRGR